MATPIPRPGILGIAPYAPGSGGAVVVHNLATNESALGPSPLALAAYRAAADGIHLYPDGSAAALRARLGAAHGLDPARIVCGAGSDELIQLLCRAYAGPGDVVVQSRTGFLMYALAAKAVGAGVAAAPEQGLTADVDALIAASRGAKIVFLANPNNPTGSYISDGEMRRLRVGLPDETLLVIDSAYAEFMEAADYDAGAALVDECDNVCMLRTFSKMYGLAGLRIGWGYFPAPVADALNRIRGPFNASAPALAAASAALDDAAFVVRNRLHNSEERLGLARDLAALGITFEPSHANFLLATFPDEAGRRAGDVREHLAANGVAVRDMRAYGLPDALRITIGTREANRRVLDLLAERFAR